MINISIIAGSKSDLPQMKKGLRWLYDNRGLVTVDKVYIASQHRHTLKVQEILTEMATSPNPPDAIIVGAGWANHLTGCCDSFLRYTLKNDTISVIGVAFEDLNDSLHTQAAILSITQVPGTQVIFEDAEGQFVGEEGFLAACKFATSGNFPEIKLKEPPKPEILTLYEALE